MSTLFENVTLIDENTRVLSGRYVAVEGGVITSVSESVPAGRFDETVNCNDRLMLPGLVNAHSHAAMTLLRGYAENLPLAEWLNHRVFPFEAKMTAQDTLAGVELAIAEMLRFGTVSFTDMYYCGEETANAVISSGIKCNFSLGTLCFDDSSLKDLPIYAQARQLIKQYHNAGGGRLKIDLCIHAEYTSSEKIVRETADFAKETSSRVHLHLSETRREHEECKQRRGGRTPARYFYDCGIFDTGATAAHCVCLEEDDFELLREKDVTAALCPVSNMKLASGCPDVKKMLEKGVRIALGTDGAASNNNLNEFEDLHFLATICKGFSLDAVALTTSQALNAATANGFLAQGRSNCGTLTVGSAADIVLLRTDVPNMRPVHDALNNVVYSAQGGDVWMTMVDGKVLYLDGEYKTLDIERTMFNAQRAAEEIKNRL